MFALLAFFALAMTFNHPCYALSVAAIPVILALWGRCAVNLWRVRVVLLLLCVFGAALWPLFVREGAPVLSLGAFFLTAEGILYGAALGIRLAAMVMAGVVFISTTSIEEFAAGLRRLGLPFPVSFAFSTAFRLVPTFLGSAASVVQAQRSRGLDLESGGPVARLRRHLPLLVPIFVNAVRSSDLLAMALESRGFGRRERSEYLQLRLRPADWMTMLACAALEAAALYARLRFGIGEVLPRI
jgi:energy-coupling factor transport system permease protein